MTGKRKGAEAPLRLFSFDLDGRSCFAQVIKFLHVLVYPLFITHLSEHFIVRGRGEHDYLGAVSGSQMPSLPDDPALVLGAFHWLRDPVEYLAGLLRSLVCSRHWAEFSLAHIVTPKLLKNAHRLLPGVRIRSEPATPLYQTALSGYFLTNYRPQVVDGWSDSHV